MGKKEPINDEKKEEETDKTTVNKDNQGVKKTEQEVQKGPSENPKPVNNKNVADNSSSNTAEKEQSFVVDGIEYKFTRPTKLQLDSWKSKYYNLCKSKIKQMVNEYNISPSMTDKDPCVVYLILTSKSINGKEDKQEWFDLYNLMDQEKIDKLYNILYREHYKLAEIEDRYQKQQEELNQKYKD